MEWNDWHSKQYGIRKRDLKALLKNAMNKCEHDD